MGCGSLGGTLCELFCDAYGRDAALVGTLRTLLVVEALGGTSDLRLSGPAREECHLGPCEGAPRAVWAPLGARDTLGRRHGFPSLSTEIMGQKTLLG